MKWTRGLPFHFSNIGDEARVFFTVQGLCLFSFGTVSGRLLDRSEGIHMGPQRGNCMAEASSDLEGPDFEKGYETEKVCDGEMLLGHAFGEAILVPDDTMTFSPLARRARITAARWRKV